MVFEGRKICHQ